MTKSNFETALKRLEEVVNRLESGELSLDQALKLFEQGIGLARMCSKRLDEVEEKVQILLAGEPGERLEPFAAGTGEEPSRD
ncbi:MAG: exodeoxyribonuclease VII small subunit [Deltaproteobacteria bacterium]|nr:exodeoxyribonuclease VII small subunit [Candidatus Anaeroferrophillacea bacterium]